MLLILVGKWVLIWWVRKLTHPTGEVAMGFMVGARSLPTLQGKRRWVLWWVREAYPPYKTLGSP